MKHPKKTSALITILLTVLAIGTTPLCRAQTPPDPANLVQVASMPATGCFWSMQLPNLPPFPVDRAHLIFWQVRGVRRPA